MNVSTESIVTVYADTVAFVLVLGLLFMASTFIGKKDEKSSGLFSLLSVLTMINSLSNGISYMLHHQNLGWPFAVRMIMPTIAEFSTLAVLFVWLVYIDYKLYGSWDRTKQVEKIFRVPVIIFLVLSVINIPTGIMFEVAEDFTFVAKPLFYVFSVVQYAYGILPIVSYVRYIKNHGYQHFFHIAPVVVPVFSAAIFTLLSSYSARSLGFAIGLVFLYFSFINRWRFDDDETGYYNRKYLNHIKVLCREKMADYHSAMIFEVSYMADELKNIFKAEVPSDGEIIRIGERKLLLLSESANSSMISALSDMIMDDTDEFDEAHPEAPIDLSAFYVIRRKNESAEDFISRIEGDVLV